MNSDGESIFHYTLHYLKWSAEYFLEYKRNHWCGRRNCNCGKISYIKDGFPVYNPIEAP